MINDCFENNQNMRAGLKLAPTDGFPYNYAFYCSYRPTYDYVHNKTHDRYNETHDRASLRDFAHHNPTPTHADPTRRVVDPLSLATVADSIMIEVDRPKSLWCRFNRLWESVLNDNYASVYGIGFYDITINDHSFRISHL